MIWKLLVSPTVVRGSFFYFFLNCDICGDAWMIWTAKAYPWHNLICPRFEPLIRRNRSINLSNWRPLWCSKSVKILESLRLNPSTWFSYSRSRLTPLVMVSYWAADFASFSTFESLLTVLLDFEAVYKARDVAGVGGGMVARWSECSSQIFTRRRGMGAC